MLIARFQPVEQQLPDNHERIPGAHYPIRVAVRILMGISLAGQ
jgi:hypothetical protein